MLEIFLNLLLIYLYLFFIGSGLYFFITPNFLKKDYLKPVLPLFYSLLLLTITGLYFINLNIKIQYIFWISMILGFCILGAAYKLKKEELFEFFIKIKNLLIKKKIYFLILFITGFVLLLPIIKAGIPTTTFRIGIDQVMYAEDTQFLLDGGTLHELQTKLISASNIAFRHDILVNQINFLVYVRYGATIIFALLGYLTSSIYAYKIINLSLIVNYFLLASLVFYFLKEVFKLSGKISFIGAIAFLFNCNLLNIFYEGGMAQIFAMPFLIFSFLLFLKLRNNNNEDLPKSDYYKIMGLFSCTLAMLSFTYNESLIAFIALLVIMNILDIFLYRKLTLKPNILFIVAVLISCIIAFPITPKFLVHSSEFVNNVKISGFPQPQWAMPSEILGFFDIYNPYNFSKWLQSSLSTTVQRNSLNFLANLILSMFAVYMYCKSIIKNNIDKTLWLAPAVLILAVFVNSNIHYANNYSYMKIYTILVPLIFIVFYSAFFLNEKSKFINKMVYVLTILLVITGFSYINFYCNTSRYVSNDMYDLFNFVRAKNYNNKVFLFKQRGSEKSKYDLNDRLFEHICIAPMKVYWVDQDSIQMSRTRYRKVPISGDILTAYLNYEPRLSYGVYLILDKKTLNCPDCIVNKNANRIIYKNNSFIIIDTGKKLSKSVVNRRLGLFDFDVFWNIML